MSAPESKEGRTGPARKPRGRPYKNVPDARNAGMLGVGMIIGAVIGAGAALLFAPQAGWETRRVISRRARSMGSGAGAWTKLGRELRKAAQAKRKTLELQAKRSEVELHKAAKGEPV
jgi:gas vesicle protein